MNYAAKEALHSSIRDAISKLEKKIETNSKLVVENKLNKDAKEYFESEIILYTQAIDQLKQIYEEIGRDLWKERVKP